MKSFSINLKLKLEILIYFKYQNVTINTTLELSTKNKKT